MLLAASLGLALTVNTALALSVGGYIVLTTAYSSVLKQVAVVDIVAVAAGFVLRAVGGAAATDQPISNWFFIVTSFGALFMISASGPRRPRRWARAPPSSAPCSPCTPQLHRLPAGRLVGGGVGRLLPVGLREGRDRRMAPIPWYQLSILPFVMAVLRYALVLDQGRGSAPEEIVLGDRPLQLIGFAWAVVFAIGVYTHEHGSIRRRRRGMDDEPGGRELVTGWTRNPATASRWCGRPAPTSWPWRSRCRATGAPSSRAWGGPTATRPWACAAAWWCSPPACPACWSSTSEAAARVLAGTSIDDLLREIVPQGWFVQVTPGTRHVTIGGAIAADVHGKDHHATGSFGAHVRSMVLGLPDGTRRTLTPPTEPEEFWATCGGMGLTGTVVEATIDLHPIETSLLKVDSDRVPDLDSLLALLVEGGRTHRYSVAWVDFLAKGRSLGRSVLDQGEFATVEDLPARVPAAASRWPMRPSPRSRPALRAPRRSTGSASPPSTRSGTARRPPAPYLMTIDKFLVPPSTWWSGGTACTAPRLPPVAVPGAVRGRGRAARDRRGPVRPPRPQLPGGAQVLRRGRPRAAVVPPGRAGRWRSTCPPPTPTSARCSTGWTAGAGGGRPPLPGQGQPHATRDLPAMYPRLDEWRAVRSLDPDRRLSSDLARRLDLLG